MTITETEAANGTFTSLRRHAGFALVPDRAFLRISGADATRWLNGMVTNSAQALQPGQGAYNFLLNAQGRIQGDGLLYRFPGTTTPEFLFVTDASQIDALHQHLDRFIIMDDVELTPAYTAGGSLLLLGPEAGQQLAALELPSPGPLQLLECAPSVGPVLLLTPSETAVPRFELRASPEVLSALEKALRANGVPTIAPATLEQLRLWEGLPRFGTDIRDRELPQETNQTHALHFAKGCYLGQEIVERIRSRGQVHRIFSAFALQGTLPALPTPLEVDGKPAGELTSAAMVPLEGGPALLALGYARREALNTRAALTYSGGIALPRPLPRAEAPFTA